jgi:uncharacterized protein YeaO (DUF488 family)
VADIAIRRVREYDGGRDVPSGTQVFLVDRIWPRGVAKADLDVTWAKEVGPSTGLRKWFGHDPERWTEFERRYTAELDDNPATEPLVEAARSGSVLLLFDAKDTERNQAVVLADWLRSATG